jgi:hypothetical protein
VTTPVPAPATRDITIYQGSTWSLHIDWTQPDGTPMPLSGATAKMTIRHAAGVGSALVELTETDGITLADGSVDVVITGQKTAALSATSAVYDLFVILANGDPHALLRGKVTIEWSVTRL